MCALVHMPVCVRTYMTARGDDVRILSFNLFSILFPLRQALSLACWSPFWLEWLTSKFWESTCVYPLVYGLPTPWLLSGYWRSELRCLCHTLPNEPVHPFLFLFLHLFKIDIQDSANFCSLSAQFQGWRAVCWTFADGILFLGSWNVTWKAVTLYADVFQHLRLASFSPGRVCEGFLYVTSQKSWLIKGFSFRKRRLLQEAEQGWD